MTANNLVAHPNISALAREHGVSRTTIRRRLANGWTPPKIEVLPPARGENHYVVQMLLNLLVNAAKAGARTVELAGRLIDGAPALEVTDDGRGLPPEAGTRLFEPFFTTAAPGEGTGLGLALCHATMERFGGGISAHAPPGGQGACFVLRLPTWAKDRA